MPFQTAMVRCMKMVASMHEINEASKEIDKIIATINEIASQDKSAGVECFY